jgi:hypothetical protein
MRRAMLVQDTWLRRLPYIWPDHLAPSLRVVNNADAKLDQPAFSGEF